jgi:hypothetical protein
MAFFSLVFMAARPNTIANKFMHDHFDPHPEGTDTRHKPSRLNEDTGGCKCMAVDAFAHVAFRAIWATFVWWSQHTPAALLLLCMCSSDLCAPSLTGLTLLMAEGAASPPPPVVAAVPTPTAVVAPKAVAPAEGSAKTPKAGKALAPQPAADEENDDDGHITKLDKEYTPTR